MKKILFLNGYSDQAPKVFHYALKIAHQMKASVLLAHVYKLEEPPLTTKGINEFKEWEETTKTIKRNKNEIEIERLEEFAERNTLKQYSTIPLEYEVTSGIPTEEVLNIVKDNNVDLIVMGMSSPNSFWQAISGNLAPQMIDKAKCPVLLIPPQADHFELSKIVYATDFLKPDQQTVKALLEWVKVFQSELHIIHIQNDIDKRKEAMENMKRLFQNIFEKNEDEKIHIQVLNGKTKESILDYLKTSEARIIAMATHRRNFWGHIFDPSMTKKIAEEANIPVLVFKKK